MFKERDYLGMVRDFQNANPDSTVTSDSNEDRKLKLSVRL